MIENPELRKVLRFEISVDKMTKLKEEFHLMKSSTRVLEDYPNLNSFYSSLVNILSSVDGD